MDMRAKPFSPKFVLSEQVARQIFGALPRQGPVVVIIDRDGNYWPSDSERFSNFNISGSFLKELCAKVDDSAEPVLTELNDCGVVAVRLATERTDCGYVIIILPQCNPESTLKNVDLIEILLNQISLIAKLVEKNNLLYELQLKHYDLHSQSGTTLNCG